MPVTNYYSVEGRMLGSGSGGGRTDYLSDALGSVTATVSQSPAVVNTYRYKPYGAQLSKTGAGADPKFTWVGTRGYRDTGRPSSDKYVRARHYGTRQASWTTTDPLWPSQHGYSYANLSPSVRIDASGMLVRMTQPLGRCDASYKLVVPKTCSDLLPKLEVTGSARQQLHDQLFCCIQPKVPGFVQYPESGHRYVDAVIDLFTKVCKHGDVWNVCFTCIDSPAQDLKIGPCIREFPDQSGIPCKDRPEQNFRPGAVAIVPLADNVGSPPTRYLPTNDTGVFPFTRIRDAYSCYFKQQVNCGAQVMVCEWHGTDDWVQQMVLHELVHVLGLHHGGSPGTDAYYKDVVFATACCLCQTLGNAASACRDCAKF
jgi:RHS repeat-associated protein